MSRLSQGGGNIISNYFARISVPYFFIASGYFLARHYGSKGWYWEAVRKRFFSLVLPYLAFVIIYEVSLWPIEIVGNILSHRNLLEDMGHRGIVQMLGMDSDNWSMARRLWFIRMLMVYVIASPIIIELARRCYLGLLALSCGIGLIFPNNISSNIVYFSVGVVLCLHPFGKVKINKFIIIALGIVLSAALWFMQQHCDVEEICIRLLDFISIAVNLTMIWLILPEIHLPAWLKYLQLPIYLVHSVVLTYVGVCIRFVDINCENYVGFTAIWFIGVAGSIFMAKAIKRITPMGYKILFGGRGS